MVRGEFALREASLDGNLRIVFYISTTVVPQYTNSTIVLYFSDHISGLRSRVGLVLLVLVLAGWPELASRVGIWNSQF